MKKILFILFIITFLINSAYAQRMYNKQSSLQLHFGLVDGKNGLLGLQYGMYKPSGQFIALFEYSFLDSKYKDFKIPYNQIALNVGYLFRVVNNYKRSIVFSAGLTAAGGYESVKSELSEGRYVDKESKFLYGITPVATLDFFINRQLGLNLIVKEQIFFNSDISKHHFVLGVGLKYLIN